MTRVSAPSVPEPPRPGMFSNARVHSQHFVISGMHAGTAAGPIGGEDTYLQAREAFRRVIALTEACGATANDILILRVYLTDIADKVAVGKARAEVFTGDFPCSTLVEVSRLVEPGLKVEIEAQGIIGAAAAHRG
ncbi:RidA family protein [Hoyosella altamirensis]|uniref:Enamine deaminase RidA (YjgF/YER057c/UK114 family) n=1 Tax=Hoyosella altamirensis TaxID=616997 RepID=A0A839RJ07_9ACTN|nr:RidA family protein [Hoyosella altamirensis]MBB3036812.1 enamine deaminase RidA (YjgF/YER057c/UK114 family) [Hoyosella altamirensis]